MPTVSWIGSNGDWSGPANWDSGTVPGPADDVEIGGAVVTLGTVAVVSSLTLDGGSPVTAELDVTGSLATDTLMIGEGLLNLENVASYDGGTITLTAYDEFGVELAPSRIEINSVLALGAGELLLDESNTNDLFGTGTLVNQGTISLPDAEALLANSLLIQPASFSNSGVVAIGSNGTLAFGSSTQFSNTGTIALAASGVLVAWLDSGIADIPGAKGSIVNNGGTVLLGLNGTIDNSGTTFDLGQANAAGVTGFAGLLHEGTVNPDGGTIYFAGATLDAVTYAGTLQPSAGSTLYVENGISVTAPDGGTALIDLSGTIGTSEIASVMQGVSRVSAPQLVQLEFLDNETLNDVSIIAGVIRADAALTLGSAVELTFSPGFDELSAATTLVNNGTIRVPDVTFSETDDSITAAAFINAGQISIGAHDIVAVITPIFENSGGITIGSGASLSVSLQATLSDLPAYLGSIGNDGGTYSVTLIGTIDNAGTVFDAAVANAESVTAISALLQGGSLVANDGTLGFGFGTTLDGVTVLGPMELSGDNQIAVRNGLTLVGSNGSGPGSVAVSGSGTNFDFLDTETIDNATFTAADLGITAQASLTLGPGVTIDHLAGGIFGLSFDGRIINDGTISGNADSGYITVGRIRPTDPFTNDGLISVGQGSFLDDKTELDGTGMIEAFGSAIATFESQVASGQTFRMAGTGNTVALYDPTAFGATLSGFTAGNTLYFNGQTITSAQYAPGHLTLFDGTTALETLAVSDDLSDAALIFSPDAGFGTNVSVACFVAGTRITTAHGDNAVEALRVGDLVRTISGALRPIRWIGRRHVDCRLHPCPRRVHPVCIAAGAFGKGVPNRDLLLSPDHAIFAEGVLIPVKYLLVGAAIRQIPCDEITYFHIELDEHDVILAEGLAAESLLPGSDWSGFENGGPAVALYPDFHSRRWEAGGCAPLVVTGPLVAALHSRLAGFTPRQLRQDAMVAASGAG